MPRQHQPPIRRSVVDTPLKSTKSERGLRLRKLSRYEFNHSQCIGNDLSNCRSNQRTATQACLATIVRRLWQLRIVSVVRIFVPAAASAARRRLEHGRRTQSLALTTTHPAHRWTSQHRQAQNGMDEEAKHKTTEWRREKSSPSIINRRHPARQSKNQKISLFV